MHVELPYLRRETRLKQWGIGRGRLVLRGRRRRHRAMGNTCCNGAGGQVGNNSRVVTHSKSARANIMRQREEDIGQYYDIEATIGRGSIGTVARAQHKESKKWYAVKTLQTQRLTKDMIDEMLNEIDIMMGLDHPNIVRPLELYSKKRELYFVIPFCSGGDLYKRAPYGERNAGRYVAQMCDAVAYMHRHAVHRDLKFENVLFMSKAPDMAPEVIRGAYDAKCDVWSLGIITYMLLAGAMPFTRFDDEDALLRDLERERYDMTRRTMAKRSEDAKAFVKYLLKAKVDQRPDMQQVLKHKWLKGRTRDYEAAANPKSLGTMDDSDSLRELRAAFRAIDTANEGFINFGELEAVLTKAGYDQTLIAEVFEAVDHDNTGRISYTEFLAAMLEGNCLFSASLVEEMIADADFKQNGTVDYEEFKKMMLGSSGKRMRETKIRAGSMPGEPAK
ncbi:serine/threonine kinase [Aureococcus anophagefferens]|nr:serine/threonine kinase [Aureococcus anophagefferens]